MMSYKDSEGRDALSISVMNLQIANDDTEETNTKRLEMIRFLMS